jgi:two-component system sensor histidine kinase BaeS
MRSLALKLTLAFLLVAVIGVVLFAVLVGQRTQSEFSRFLSARDQQVLVNALTNYYAARDSWEGVNDQLAKSSPFDLYLRSAVLADAQGKIIIGDERHAVGQTLQPEEIEQAVAIQVDGITVGYIRFTPTGGPRPGYGDGYGYPKDRPSSGPRPPPNNDNDFIGRIGEAALVSAGIAALAALAIGVILARTLTRPVRELTLATKTMAAGNLGQQVVVHSNDEIGQLAQSFNQMSSDLARASQSRKQMTADLAHDLRTPLSILRGYTEGLEEGRLQGSPKLYGIMHAEVEHLQRLVEDLRTLSLADAGEIRLNKRAVDPKALLERTALAYFVQAEERGVALRVEAPDGLPSINVDTDRITQVLNNLVSNALRHTAQGEVVLSASAPSDSRAVEIKVRDTGSGIAADDLPYVFDRFYRSDKSRQRAEGDDDSSGLGLAIAKAIVEAHGGTIKVASAPGQGTTFTIMLPN